MEIITQYILATGGTAQSYELVCFPAGVTVQQVRDIVIKLLVDQPKQRHLSAAVLRAPWDKRRRCHRLAAHCRHRLQVLTSKLSILVHALMHSGGHLAFLE